MKIKTTDTMPDGMLLTISEIFVDTEEEKEEVVKAIERVLQKQKKRMMDRLRNTDVIYDEKEKCYYFKSKKDKNQTQETKLEDGVHQ